MSIESKTCPICVGSGWVKVAKNSVKCAACRGTGVETVERLLGYDEKVCKPCQGTGWAEPVEY
jgi:DnaJ-class molecular chaperone